MSDETRRRLPTVGAALGLLLAATMVVATAMPLPAQAGNWKGTEETQDGVVHVHNPAEAIDPAMTIELEEVYRLGGWSEDQFFGVIADIVEDDDGNIYLLDAQLNEIQIYSSTGDFVDTIGREGEAPGEFRGANTLFWLPTGALGILQVFPGRIVSLNADGTPGEDFKLEELEGAGFRLLFGARRSGDKLAVVYAVNEQSQEQFTQTNTLGVFDGEGQEEAKLIQAQSQMVFATPKITEREFDIFRNRWTTGPDGHIYVAPAIDDYRINVYAPDGSLERVIHREFEPYPRTADQKQQTLDIYKGFTRNIPIPGMQHEVEENHPVIAWRGVHVRPDGSLWVQTSRGSVDNPDDEIGAFDVYDPKGRYVRRVTLKGQCDSVNDGIFFVGDRIYVVTQFLTSAMAAQGGGAPEDESALEEDAEPMALICYRSDKLDEAAGIPSGPSSRSR